MPGAPLVTAAPRDHHGNQPTGRLARPRGALTPASRRGTDGGASERRRRRGRRRLRAPPPGHGAPPPRCPAPAAREGAQALRDYGRLARAGNGAAEGEDGGRSSPPRMGRARRIADGWRQRARLRRPNRLSRQALKPQGGHLESGRIAAGQGFPRRPS